MEASLHRTRWFPASLVVPLLLAVPAGARGQAPLSLTVSGGAAVPVASFRGTDAGETAADASFGVHFALRSTPMRTLYAGFSQHRFACGQGGCPGGDDLVSTAWDLGARIRLLDVAVAPWVQLGVVFLRVERHDAASPGGPVAVSDLAVGGEVGAGLVVPWGERFALRPGVRYALADTRFDESRLRMRYVVADLAVMVGF